MREWLDFFGANDPSKVSLIRAAVVADVKMQRSFLMGNARTARHMRNAEMDLDRQRLETLPDLIDRLPIEPDRVVPLMKSMPEGCAWLIERLKSIRDILEVEGWLSVEDVANLGVYFGKSNTLYRFDRMSYLLLDLHLDSGEEFPTTRKDEPKEPTDRDPMVNRKQEWNESGKFYIKMEKDLWHTSTPSGVRRSRA